MAHGLIAWSAGAALLFAAAAASAQAPPPPPVAIPNPAYTTMVLELSVDRPAAAVWARVGKFCDIREWLRNTCAITSGTESQLGAVRALGGGAVIEMMVGKTDLSYTYTQPVYEGRPYNLYHGCLEVKPLTAKTSRIVYTLMYDNSRIAGDDAAKAAEIQRRRTAFEKGVANMKTLAEGGALPPPAPPMPR